MNIKLKTLVAACGGLAVLLLSGTVSADTGYYAETPMNQPANIPSGPAGNPGPGVTVLEKTVKAGAYLITAQIFGYSYAPNSGAVCYFTGKGAESGWGWRTLNTSSDWYAQKLVSMVMLGKYTATEDGTKVTVSCIRGYYFTWGSQFYGTMMLNPVQNLE